jgi:hypothetical protein
VAGGRAFWFGGLSSVLGDLLGAPAVLAAGVVIAITGLMAADAVASIVIGLLILPRTWSLLRDSVDVLLEATPKDVDLTEVRRHVLESPGVEAVHDLHAWTITNGMNVVSAHVVLKPDANPGAILDHLGTCLADDFDIDHSTFQLETRSTFCGKAGVAGPALRGSPPVWDSGLLAPTMAVQCAAVRLQCLCKHSLSRLRRRPTMACNEATGTVAR